MKTDTKYTVLDAAKAYSRSTGRIRKVCIDDNIGRCVGGRIRLFTAVEFEALGKRLAHRKPRKVS